MRRSWRLVHRARVAPRPLNRRANVSGPRALHDAPLEHPTPTARASLTALSSMSPSSTPSVHSALSRCPSVERSPPTISTCFAYPSSISGSAVRHTSCTVGSSSGRPDRSGVMYPLRVGVTMSIHTLTAGSGYDYLTRQVAALDATEKVTLAWRPTTPNGVNRLGCGSALGWTGSTAWQRATR